MHTLKTPPSAVAAAGGATAAENRPPKAVRLRFQQLHCLDDEARPSCPNVPAAILFSRAPPCEDIVDDTGEGERSLSLGYVVAGRLLLLLYRALSSLDDLKPHLVILSNSTPYTAEIQEENTRWKLHTLCCRTP